MWINETRSSRRRTTPSWAWPPSRWHRRDSSWLAAPRWQPAIWATAGLVIWIFSQISPSFVEAVGQFTEALRRAGHSVDPIQSLSPTMCRLTASGITIDLAVDAPSRLVPSTTAIDAMPLRSLRDLAADKTLALFDRATIRDFVDVYVLLQRHYQFGELLALAASKDPGFDPGWFARALQHAARLNPADVDLLVPINFPAMQQRFLDEAVRLTALRSPHPNPE